MRYFTILRYSLPFLFLSIIITISCEAHKLALQLNKPLTSRQGLFSLPPLFIKKQARIFLPEEKKRNLNFLRHSATMQPSTESQSLLEAPPKTECTEDEEPQSIPKKILLMVEPTPFTWVSGYATRYKELLRYLSKSENSVLILTTDESTRRPYKAYGFPIFYTDGFKLPFYDSEGYTLTADIPQFKGWELMKNFHPDILHVTSPGFLVLTSTFLYSKIFQVPLVLAYHTHLPAYAPKYITWIPYISTVAWLYIRWVHNHADLTLVTSPELKEEMNSWGIERISLWRKGIDTERFNPKHKSLEMRKRMSNGNPESPLLLNVGRLSPEKDLTVLREVIDKVPNACLAFVGSGPLEESLKELFKGTNTVFMGSLEGTELSEAFASCDIFCMPSTTETLGFVVLESMASGIPVIGSRAGGVQNLVAEGKTGYLVDPLNAEQFSEKIKYLIKNPDVGASFGKAARAEAELWNWADTMAHLQKNQYSIAIKNFQERKFNDSWIFRLMRWILRVKPIEQSKA